VTLDLKKNIRSSSRLLCYCVAFLCIVTSSQSFYSVKMVPPVEMPMLQTRVRQTITPYLPPPVIRGIQQIDAQLLDTVGPEASVTILSTLLVGWLTISIVRFLSSRVGRGKGRAIADEDEDHVLSGSSLKKVVDYDATVLLCGPTKAGKTRLYYQMCYREKNMPTVMSIKANVGLSKPAVVATTEDDTKESSSPKEPVIRYMDWPGHASLDDPALKQVLQSQPRIVLVLDATQPAAPAADTLDELLSLYASRPKKSTKTIPIFVACHKKDFPKAKNWRRCKIQIRTELERLLSVRQGSEDLTSWWPKGEALDLEKLPGGIQLHFASTTCESTGCPELEHFCRTGELPAEEAS
jgi:signal recognition particle receptor subunit beta